MCLASGCYPDGRDGLDVHVFPVQLVLVATLCHRKAPEILIGDVREVLYIMTKHSRDPPVLTDAGSCGWRQHRTKNEFLDPSLTRHEARDVLRRH